MKTVNQLTQAGYSFEPKDGITIVKSENLFYTFNPAYHSSLKSIMESIQFGSEPNGTKEIFVDKEYSGDDRFPLMLLDEATYQKMYTIHHRMGFHEEEIGRSKKILGDLETEFNLLFNELL